MTGPDIPAVHRESVPLRILPDLLEWVAQHCQAGGLFGSASQAIERGLWLLRHEYLTIRDRCKREGIPFQSASFWKLYEHDLAATKPYKPGRRKEGESRIRLDPYIAIELLVWARDTLVEDGPFEGMSQAAEVGLRHLRSQDLDELGHARQPFDAGALWRNYQVARRNR